MVYKNHTLRHAFDPSGIPIQDSLPSGNPTANIENYWCSNIFGDLNSYNYEHFKKKADLMALN